jgi:hypothetical protein
MGCYKGRPATFDRAGIVALRKEGMGATEIARVVGVQAEVALKAAGLNSRPRASRGSIVG